MNCRLLLLALKGEIQSFVCLNNCKGKKSFTETDGNVYKQSPYTLK